MQLPTTWDTIARSYAEDVSRQMAPFMEEALRVAALRPTDHLLDVATGPGSLALAAAKRCEHVVAVDFSPGMIEQLSSRASATGVTNLDARVMDAQALALPDESFDAAFCVFGFMFFPDRARAFRELVRVLKPGGRAVVVTWAPLDRRPLMKVGFDALAEVLPDMPRPAKGDLQDPAECRREMSDAGFRGVVTTPFTASVWFEPEAYGRMMMRATPVALLEKKLGEEKFRAATQRLVEELRRRMPAEGSDLAAEAIITLGTR